MSKKEDLFELMERYNLTLRRLPNTETECYSFMHYRGLPNEEVFEADGPSMTEEKFKLEQSQNCFVYDRWENGKVIRKLVRKTIQREGGWLVKIGGGYGSTQLWSKKYDYFGNTPEEAILKAVKSITQ